MIMLRLSWSKWEVINWFRIFTVKSKRLLTEIYQMLLTLYLVNIFTTLCRNNTELTILDIKNHVMLPHDSTSEHYFVLILGICSNTVLIITWHAHILTRVPFKFKFFALDILHSNLKYWITCEILIKSIHVWVVSKANLCLKVRFRHS